MTDSERYAHISAILRGYELGRFDNEPDLKARVENCLVAGVEALDMSTGADLHDDFTDMIHRGCLYDLFGMIGYSISKWDDDYYNEPLAKGDSHCYWVCFLGENDSLETFSTSEDYYKRLIELWDYWIWEGTRSSALEPFENEFNPAEIVENYDLQPYLPTMSKI